MSILADRPVEGDSAVVVPIHRRRFRIWGGDGSGPETNGHSPIAPRHLEMLTASDIPLEHATARGYETITDSRKLAALKIVKAARSCVPGLLVPMLRADGSTWGYQYRPDIPRLREGKPVKYETPYQQRNGLDIPPGMDDLINNPEVPLWVTEGVKKADCGAQYGLCIIALSGVWNWRGTNDMGGKTAVADWNEIALNGRRVILAFDGDVARKNSAAKALSELAEYLRFKGASVEYLHLPDTKPKTGLDDYLCDGHTVEDLWKLVKPNPPPIPEEDDEYEGVEDDNEPKQEPPQPISLAECHEVFHKWLGEDYDTDALNAMLATAAVERFEDDSDPIWLLLISGPGNAKTETVQSLDGAGAIVTSSIASDAALLSGTPKREHERGATGGLLRKMGPRGLLVIKDVTSILSMDRTLRAKVLAALREIYDGRWTREVGSGGGTTLSWRGRIATIGAVTTAWDTHHSVVSAMGDRFVLVRMDSTVHRQEAGRKAIGNTGSELEMRAELAAAAGGVIVGMSADPITLSPKMTERLLGVADLVTKARTGVERDYKGNVLDAHAPEMPTRFAKQLAQVVRGAVAIGLDRKAALRLAIRCGRDSVPPLRLAILHYLAEQPESTTTDVRKGIDKPHTSVDRELQALHMLGLVTVYEVEREQRSRWYYRLVEGVDPRILGARKLVREKLVAEEQVGRLTFNSGKVKYQPLTPEGVSEG